jgi:hypothetical protein
MNNVLYHSLLGLTSGRQVCGRFVRNGDYSLKWIAATKCAQWHSYTLARLSLLIPKTQSTSVFP